MGLAELFANWRAEKLDFDSSVRMEMESAAHGYFGTYVDFMKRVIDGDVTALLFAPADSSIVQAMLMRDEKMPMKDRVERIRKFFTSDYYTNVPCEQIGACIFALLRQRVYEGAYRNDEKAAIALAGLFFDVRFISAYAPYCNAMFLDNQMRRYMTDSPVDLRGRYGVRIFSRDNWQEFIGYLEGLRARVTDPQRHALQLVHP